MIKEPTVFILGAGASMPYGFPSGAALRQAICKVADGFDELAQKLQSLIDIDAAETIDFAKQFQRSNVASIDAFLARRPEFTVLGKLCIAAVLCEKENPDPTIRGMDDDHWYAHLWNDAIIDGVTNLGMLHTNRIRFITFNYDRSLEYFLCQSIKHTFGVANAVALDACRKFEILHVYGALGDFDIRTVGYSREYGGPVNAATLGIAAKGINVIPESRNDAPEFERARNWCAEARKIAFLGFGFDPLNLARLDLVSVMQWCLDQKQPLPSIVASGYGRTASEMARSKESVIPMAHWRISQEKCVMTLRSHTDLFA
jgi:hypothetical protein